MAKTFTELQYTIRRNGVTKDFMRLWHRGVWWDEGIEAHLWEECWRRNRKIRYLPDYYYDKARYCLFMDTGRIIGDEGEFLEYWKKYPTIRKNNRKAI